MPYDICEDEASLDCIEGEMAARGITQRLIDSTRGSTERRMLRDLKSLAAAGEDLEYRDHQGATPVRKAFHKVLVFLIKKFTKLVVGFNNASVTSAPECSVIIVKKSTLKAKKVIV